MSGEERCGRAERAWRERAGLPPSGSEAWRTALEAHAASLDLGPELVALSAEVASLAPAPTRRGVHLLALAVLAELERGSTRTPLDSELERLRPFVPLGPLGIEALDAVRSVLAEPEQGAPATARVGREERAPLLLGEGYVAAERFLRLEQSLGARIAARPPSAETVVARSAFEALRNESETAARLTPEQASAVVAAAQSKLTVITGGPGTGKTSVVVVLLELLARLGFDVASEVALAAPTGKATNRLLESVRTRIPPSELPPAETLHRLLGARPGRPFARNRENPVPVRLLVVDEASMLDLELADQLLEALEPESQLVLLGDADQLPSVEAGAVLRDLVTGLTEAHVHRLTQSFRMDPKDPDGRAVLLAARALAAGDEAGFFKIANDGAPSPVRFTSLEEPRAVDAWLEARLRTGPLAHPEHRARARRVRRFVNGAFSEADVSDLAQLQQQLTSVQLLTVTRRRALPHGAEAVNARLHKLYAELEDLRETDRFLPGEPVMMRANDYERKLFNGDVGMVVRVAVDQAPVRPMAVFTGAKGPTPFDLSALGPQLELAHAMTVHKAQGSEHDGIQLLLPSRDVPILSPEVLYTAATRARRSVEIAGGLERLRSALQIRSPRASGLATILGEET